MVLGFLRGGHFVELFLCEAARSRPSIRWKLSQAGIKASKNGPGTPLEGVSQEVPFCCLTLDGSYTGKLRERRCAWTVLVAFGLCRSRQEKHRKWLKKQARCCCRCCRVLASNHTAFGGMVSSAILLQGGTRSVPPPVLPHRHSSPVVTLQKIITMRWRVRLLNRSRL